MSKWLRVYIHKYKLEFGEVSVARKERGLGLDLQRKRVGKRKGGSEREEAVVGRRGRERKWRLVRCGLCSPCSSWATGSSCKSLGGVSRGCVVAWAAPLTYISLSFLQPEVTHRPPLTAWMRR